MKFYALLFLLTPLLVTAQERELLTIQQSRSKLSYNDTAASTQLFDLRVRLPLWNNKKNTLMATVGYKQMGLNDFPELFTKKLFGTTAQVAWLHKMSAKNSLAVMAQIGLFSDMKDVSSKDIRYTLALRYRIKHHERVSTGWGFAYSRQFFGHQIVPFIDIDYQPNNKWTISGQFPVRPRIQYHLDKRLSLGIEVAGEASSYRLSATQKNNQFIQTQQWTGLFLAEYKLSQSWQIHFGVGKNMKQSYRVYNDTQATPWTIITIPVGKREEPIRRIDDKGFNMQLGISFNPFW